MALNNIEKIRFWCHKVLPLVYDDSLSYYETVCKVVHYLNETIEAVNLNNETVEEVAKQVADFIGATPEMVKSFVDEWLNRHPEVTTTVMDGSLTEAKFSDELKLYAIKDYVTPQMFGAKGDGVTDDTNAFVDALYYCKENNILTMYVPSGNYVIDSVGEQTRDSNVRYGKVFLPSNFTLNMSENAFLIVKPTDSQSYSCLTIKDSKNVVIHGGNIIGDRDAHLGTDGEWGYGIMLDSSENVLIDSVNITKCWGDCIDLRSDSTWVTPAKEENKNIKITKCTLSDSRRQGISIESGVGVLIEGCSIFKINGTDPQCGIDIESNGREITKNIKIIGCVIEECYKGIALWSADNCIIDACTISGVTKTITTTNSTPECAVTNSNIRGYIEIASEITYIGNTFSDSEISFVDAQYSNTMIISNRFINSYIEGFPTADNVKNIVISGNVFEGENNTGVNLWNVKGVKFTNNAMVNMARGVQLYYCSDSSINNNTFEKIEYTPIILAGSSYIQVNSNLFIGCVNAESDYDSSNSIIHDAYGQNNDISYNDIKGSYGTFIVRGIALKSGHTKCVMNSIINTNGSIAQGIYVNADYCNLAYNDLTSITGNPIVEEYGRVGNQIKEQFYATN